MPGADLGCKDIAGGDKSPGNHGTSFSRDSGTRVKEKQPVNNGSEKLSVHDSCYVEKENRLHLIVTSD